MITHRTCIRAWIFTFMLFTGLSAGNLKAQNNSTTIIPESHYYPHTNGYTNVAKDTFFTIPSFEATPLITLGEYKEFMASVSGKNEYPDSLMPDRSISNEEAYEKYMEKKKYESEPVLGVSWKNAIEYCIWRTKLENPDSGIVFIYRLPYKSEWIQMALYADSVLKNYEINRHYAEWIMASFDESAFLFTLNSNSAFHYEYLYFAKESDPQVLKRMCIYGKSFISNDKYKMYGYSDHGYRDVGFRLVKEYINVLGQKPSTVLLNKKLMELYGVKSSNINQ